MCKPLPRRHQLLNYIFKVLLNPGVYNLRIEVHSALDKQASGLRSNSRANLKVSSYENNISVLVNTKNKDIIATRNMILNIEPRYTTINVLETLR